ncbi:hypothetical protein [Tautonia marina]|uniref:hypothetical protein n=1 Tax=Tautonia marina TaxID=2653855 RepID=UPI001260889F|nr:hypothetical protein [Tautonia marina]
MKTIRIEQTSLDSCVRDAQHERVILTKDGIPIALVVGLEGFDAEQLEQSSSAAFWKLISERRAQPTMSRAELERSFED